MHPDATSMFDISDLDTVTAASPRTCRQFADWILAFLTTKGRARRLIAARIRELARMYPDLVDELPGDVYDSIYRVRARGTQPPALALVRGGL